MQYKNKSINGASVSQRKRRLLKKLQATLRLDRILEGKRKR